MDETEFGLAFRDLRKGKGFTLHEAAGDIVSVQFLSQFERGESQISYAKLSSLLNNIHVDVAELVAMKHERNSDWVDRWAHELEDALRVGNANSLDATIAPERLRGVVAVVNKIATLRPAERRAAINRSELMVLANVVQRTLHYGVFMNLVIFYSAHVLPGKVIRVAVQRLASSDTWEEARYLRAGTTMAALWGLAETEIYQHNYLKAQYLINAMDKRISGYQAYERIGLRCLEAELARSRGDVATANQLRDSILALYRVLGDDKEQQTFADHFATVWQELTVTT